MQDVFPLISAENYNIMMKSGYEVFIRENRIYKGILNDISRVIEGIYFLDRCNENKIGRKIREIVLSSILNCPMSDEKYQMYRNYFKKKEESWENIYFMLPKHRKPVEEFLNPKLPFYMVDLSFSSLYCPQIKEGLIVQRLRENIEKKQSMTMKITKKFGFSCRDL